jgi:hypothetical protein
MDMMEEYDDPLGSNNHYIIQSKKLKDDIKKKEFHKLNDCSSQTQIDESKIIVLRKQDKTRLGFIKLDNTTIECTDDQYYALASHNFRIFIQDILQWNPFLNLPQHKKKEEQQGWQGYSGPHKYSSEMTFTTDAWWNKQKWWTDYKGTAEAAEESRRAAAAAAEARRAAAQELTSSPQPARTQPTIEQQRAELPILTTVLNKLKTRLNDLQTEEKISEDVKNIINTEIDTLLSSTSQVFSS